MNYLTNARNIGLVGGVTKICFFLLAVIYFILAITTSISGVNWIMVLILSPDLIQGIMYLEFYFNFDKV